MKNTFAYVGLYLLVMIPTYVLPYFGSNSVLASAIHKGVSGSIYPLFWIHLSFSLGLCLLAWLRGESIAKAWLVVLPVVATVFDLVPGLNVVPLVPTALNICAIIFGAKRQVESDPVQDVASGTSVPMKMSIGLGSIVVCWGMAVYGHFDPFKPRPSSQSAQKQPPSKPNAPQPPSSLSASPAPVMPPGSKSAPQPLSPLWYGKWVRQGVEPIVINQYSFRGCTWLDRGTDIPKREGCWASYGATRNGALIVSWLGKTESFSPELTSLVKSIRQEDNFKIVHIVWTDEKGAEETVGDCLQSYFYDKQRIVEMSSCQREKVEVDLNAYTKAQ